MWDFVACFEGFKKRHGIKSNRNPKAKFTREEAEELLQFAQEELARDKARDEKLKGQNGGN